MREAGAEDPDLARAALAGLSAYQAAPRAQPPRPRTVFAQQGSARLLDHGGDGPPLVLIPSLINPPRILDLDADVSLADAIARMGRRALLLDWGSAGGRASLSVAGHIEHILLPLLAGLDRPLVLLGYCLGGTMAIAAADRRPVEGLLTLAAPWDFSHYPTEARVAIERMWRQSEATAHSLGFLPIEVLQAAFWSLDPERTVRKFAHFATLDPHGDTARRFVELEEWANEGEPIPYPAAKELLVELFGANRTGAGRWNVEGRPVAVRDDVPMLHCLARDDRIAPSSTAPPGPAIAIDSGHVGMVVGSRRSALHATIAEFLSTLDA